MTQNDDALKERYINLASPKLGSEVVYATDDFFADKSRLIKDSDPVFIEDKYDDHGKWMDGWESRRRRDGGSDHAIIKLGAAGVIAAINIDTAFFTGNFPPAASLEGCLSDTPPTDSTVWISIVPSTPLSSSAQHIIEVSDDQPYNWLRLNMFPDGGIARLRVYGDVFCAWDDKDAKQSHELSAIGGGGRVVGFNNAHYGNTWSLLCAGRGENMGDGWETRRRREPGHDWIIIALGAEGLIDRIELDTAYFRGNYPDGFSLQAANLSALSKKDILAEAAAWQELLPRQKLQADHQHYYSAELDQSFGAVTHIRLNIYPDGGVSRFRAFGRLAGRNA